MLEVGINIQNGHPGMPIRRNSGPKVVCQCCPYGYHIDLDFVRFCEMLSKDSGEPSVAKRQRRERRRQRQSMEVLLGLTSPVIWNIEQLLPTIVQESSPTTSDPPPPPIRTSSLTNGNDDLKKAVLDFEATFERTSKKRPNDLPLVSPAQLTRKSSFKSKPEDGSPQDGIIEFDSISLCSIGSGISAGPLQNIREQMAISLERMKELEERVKLIPNLQNQLQSLKEERNRLLEKLEQKKEQKNVTIKNKSSMRDVGVMCIVLTRDVGVTPVVRKFKTTATEPMETTVKSIESQTKAEIQTKSTLTDLFMSDLIDKTTKRLSLKDLDVEIPRQPEKMNKSVQVSGKEPVVLLQVVEKREIGVQVEGQTRQTREVGVTAKPKVSDIGLDVRPKMRDVGVSEDKTTNLVCDKCRNVKTKSIGVGYGNVKIPETPSMPSRSKSFDYTKTNKLPTRNVGVGTVTPVKKLTATKTVDTTDFANSRSKHIGVNTNKMKLVDAAVGHDLLPKTERVVCDKCKNDVKPTVKSILKETGESSHKDVTPSKIPRPKSTATTPVMERKKFMRQDTYTKIDPVQQQQPSEAGKKTKTRLKSPLDKLDTQPEDKVEVTLRKKNKTSEQTDPIHRISTGLRDSQLNENDERYSGQFEDFCFDYDENYDEQDSKRNSTLFPENTLFQPIQDKPREKIKPSKEMKAAMKVVNDSLTKYPNGLPRHLKNASNIIQQEWFKISSTAAANPLDVEDYLDSFEEVSSTLLEYIVNMVDNNGNTAMHYAVSHGNFDVVSILLDSKVCNINKANAAGYTCIMLVSLAQVRSETHRQVIRRLFQLADVNVRAKQHGQTALMLAVSHGRLDMVKLLLEAGADPNIQDGDGSTALMCAAEHGHTEIVKHILSHPDCDPSIVDCDGSTALAISMEAGNRDIGVLLYAREHFTSTSRGSSPYTSQRQRRSKAIASPHSRTPTSPNPGRRSDHSV